MEAGIWVWEFPISRPSFSNPQKPPESLFNIMALRDEIKTYCESKESTVLAVPTPELPQWDGKIFVCRISPTTLSNHLKNVENGTDDDRSGFVQLVSSDEKGSRIFQPEDILFLSTCAEMMPVTERLYWAGRHINGLTEESRNAWKKNLKNTAESGSPSFSAEPSPPGTGSTMNAS